MDPFLFYSFLAATLFIVVTPGPSVALASSQAVRFGPRAAILTVAGDAFGSVVHILIAVASLQTLLSLSDIILPYLQMVGGLFILYFAFRAFADSREPADPEIVPTASPATFIAGFVACVTNPKAIVFFVALFPAFISPTHSVAVQSLIYGVIFVALDAAFILGYALLAMVSFRKALSHRVRIETISGFGLLGVGLALIFKGYRALPTS